MIGIKISDDVATASFVEKKSWVFGPPVSMMALEVMIMPDKEP